MSSLKNWVLSPEMPCIRLMDGGVSTHLENLLQAQDPPKSFEHRSLWSSSLLMTPSGQDTILQGHKDWLAAGSDILTTVTYQCKFGTYGEDLSIVTPAEMTSMMKKGIMLGQQAVDELSKDSFQEQKRFVVASSGCYGAALADGSEYTGNYPNIQMEGLVEFHQKKGKVFLDCDPDGLAIETIPSVEECTAACRALRSLGSETACGWVSLACKDGETLNEGTPFVNALKAIREVDPEAKYVQAIGINCCDSAHIGSLLELLTRHMAREGPRRGIVVYPNSGEEWDAANEAWREGTGCTDADKFSDRLLEAVDIIQRTWKDEGQSGSTMPRLIIGGCCRTSPGTIAALRQRIDEWHTKNKL